MSVLSVKLLVVALVCSWAFSLPIEESLNAPQSLLQKILNAADVGENDVTLSSDVGRNDVTLNSDEANFKDNNGILDRVKDVKNPGTSFVETLGKEGVAQAKGEGINLDSLMKDGKVKADVEFAKEEKETNTDDQPAGKKEIEEASVKNDKETDRHDEKPIKNDKEPIKNVKESTQMEDSIMKDEKNDLVKDDQDSVKIGEQINDQLKPEDKDNVTDVQQTSTKIEVTDQQIPFEGNGGLYNVQEDVLSKNDPILMPDVVHLLEYDEDQDQEKTVSTQVDKNEDELLEDLIFNLTQKVQEEDYEQMEDPILIPLDDGGAGFQAGPFFEDFPDDDQQPTEESPILLPFDTLPQGPGLFEGLPDDMVGEPQESDGVNEGTVLVEELPAEENDGMQVDNEQLEPVADVPLLTPVDVLSQEPSLTQEIPVVIDVTQEPSLIKEIPNEDETEGLALVEEEDGAEPLIENPFLTPLDTLPQEPSLIEDIPVVVLDEPQELVIPEENDEPEEPLVDSPFLTPLDTLPQEPSLIEGVPIAVTGEYEEPILIKGVPAEENLEELAIFAENDDSTQPLVVNPLLTSLDTLPQEPQEMPIAEIIESQEPVSENPFFIALDTPSEMEGVLGEESDLSDFPDNEESLMSFDDVSPEPSFPELTTNEYEEPQGPMFQPDVLAPDMFSSVPQVPEELPAFEDHEESQQPMSTNPFRMSSNPLSQEQEFERIPSYGKPLFETHNQEVSMFGMMNPEIMDDDQTFGQYPIPMGGPDALMSGEGTVIIIDDGIPFQMFPSSEDFPQNNLRRPTTDVMDDETKVKHDKLIPVMDETYNYFSVPSNSGMDEEASSRTEHNFNFDEDSSSLGVSDSFQRNSMMPISEDSSDLSMNPDSSLNPFGHSPMAMNSYAGRHYNHPFFMNYGFTSSASDEPQQAMNQRGNGFGMEDRDSQDYMPFYMNRNIFEVPRRHFEWRGMTKEPKQAVKPTGFDENTEEPYNSRTMWDNLGFSGFPFMDGYQTTIDRNPEPEMLTNYPSMNQQIFGNTFKARESSDKEDAGTVEENLSDNSKVEDMSSFFPSTNLQSFERRPYESPFYSISNIFKSLSSLNPNLGSSVPIQDPFGNGYQPIIIVLDPSTMDISVPTTTTTKTDSKPEENSGQEKSITHGTDPTKKNNEPVSKKQSDIKMPYIPAYNPNPYNVNFELGPYFPTRHLYSPYGDFQPHPYTPVFDTYSTIPSESYNYHHNAYDNRLKPYFSSGVFPRREFDERENLAAYYY